MRAPMKCGAESHAAVCTYFAFRTHHESTFCLQRPLLAYDRLRAFISHVLRSLAGGQARVIVRGLMEPTSLDSLWNMFTSIGFLPGTMHVTSCSYATFCLHPTICLSLLTRRPRPLTKIR